MSTSTALLELLTALLEYLDHLWLRIGMREKGMYPCAPTGSATAHAGTVTNYCIYMDSAHFSYNCCCINLMPVLFEEAPAIVKK